MKLSLSTRVAESFGDKRHAAISLDEVAADAVDAGYHALCMRASQVGVDDTRPAVRAAAKTVEQHGLEVSMVTGDFAIPENTDESPAALRNIEPYLDLAEGLDCDLLRVAMKTADDVEWAREAADEALERGVRLAHQCHTQSLFETVDETVEVLHAVGRPNFGLIYEPANLELCGQPYAGATIETLAPWIFNVYLQNQRLHPGGSSHLDSWTGGTVRFDLLPLHESGGIDVPQVLHDLVETGYDGYVTVHQAGVGLDDTGTAAREAARFLRGLAPFEERTTG